MSSLWKCVITFVITALLISGIWIFVMHMRTEKITEEFQGEIAQLTATLDALGPAVECYTVSESFVSYYDNDTTGQIMTEASIEPITIPSSLVGDAYITDMSQIIGKYCKVNIKPGTPLTGDLLMAEWYDDTLRDVDIIVQSRVVGMRVGDYVDIRITMPFGEDYVVFPHKRIQYIGDQSIKVYLTEDELHTWQAATVDYYLRSAEGCRIYLTKYLEPGVQQSAVAYYAPSERVKEVMKKDPNIVVEAQRKLEQTMMNRPAIDEILSQFIDEKTTIQQQTGQIQGGRNAWSSGVMSDYRVLYNEQEQAKGEGTEDEEEPYVEEEVVVNFDEQSTEGSTEGVGTTQPSIEETQTPVTEPESQGETVAPETLPEETQAVETQPESQTPVIEPESIEDPDFAG